MEARSRHAPGDGDGDNGDGDEEGDDDNGDDDEEGDVGRPHLNVACSLCTAKDSVEELHPPDSDWSAKVDGKPRCGLPIRVAKVDSWSRADIRAPGVSIDALGCSQIVVASPCRRHGGRHRLQLWLCLERQLANLGGESLWKSASQVLKYTHGVMKIHLVNVKLS